MSRLTLFLFAAVLIISASHAHHDETRTTVEYNNGGHEHGNGGHEHGNGGHESGHGGHEQEEYIEGENRQCVVNTIFFGSHGLPFTTCLRREKRCPIMDEPFVGSCGSSRLRCCKTPNPASS